MIKITNITDRNSRYSYSLTVYPICWHAFVMHHPTTSGNEYEAENFVVGYVFDVQNETFTWRCETWIKGADGAPPYVYIVYDNSLYYVQKFSLDYSKRNAEGIPAVDTEYTPENIMYFLEHEFFDDRGYVQRRYETPEFFIDSEMY